VSSAQRITRLPPENGVPTGGKTVARQATHELDGQRVEADDLLGLVVAQVMMTLGVVTVRAGCRKRACCEHAKYHRCQKKPHELSHTDLSPCLLRTLRFWLMLLSAVPTAYRGG